MGHPLHCIFVRFCGSSMQLCIAGFVTLLRDFFFFFRPEFGDIEKSVTMNINTRNVNDNGRSGHVDAIARRADGFSIILNHSHIHVIARYTLVS